MQSDSEDLVQRAKVLAEAARRGHDWLIRNQAEFRQDVRTPLKNLRRAVVGADKLSRTANRKMCAGVFGPSQTGKSYLISQLAKPTDTALMADFQGRQVDFLREINPQGGGESTGLVTRFTMDRPSGAPNDHPVFVRLLSQLDLVKILVNSYALDVNHDAEDEVDHDPGAILDNLEQAGQTTRVEGAGVLDEYDVADLEDYCRQNLIKNPRIKVLNKIGFWDRFAEIAATLAPSGKIEVLSLLWDKEETLTRFYRDLHSALEKLDFAEEAFCSYSALENRESSIIDVARLEGLGQASSDLVSVMTAEGRRADLSRSELTGLVAELGISMAELPHEFISHTDLLDFPGARSRQPVDDLQKYIDGTTNGLSQLFLRGKVDHLFKRYSVDQELTSLLLCLVPGNQETVGLPDILDSWIKLTHGQTPEQRVGKSNALFLIFTKFNLIAFERGGGKTTDKHRWEVGLKEAFTNYLARSHNWPDQWTPNESFTNCYWLRNPEFPNHGIFEYKPLEDEESGVEGKSGPDGEDELGPEEGLSADGQAFIDAIRAGNLESELVARHFSDPGADFDAAMVLNDGGIERIVGNLVPLCNPKVKKEQMETRLQSIAETVDGVLRPFYFSGDVDQEREKKLAMAMQLSQQLALCAQRQRIGDLLALLQVSENDLYDVYIGSQMLRHRPAQGASGEAEEEQPAPPPRAARNIGPTVSADDLLGDIFGDSGPPVAAEEPKEAEAAEEPSREAPADSISVFVREVQRLWSERLDELNQNEGVLNHLAMTTEDLGNLCQELKLAARRLDLFDQIDREVHEAQMTKRRDISKEALIWRGVVPAANLLNEFVMWLGYGGPFSPDGSELEFKGKTRHVFRVPPPINGLPELGSSPTPYDRDFYGDWIFAFMCLVNDNVVFQSGIEANLEENAALGEILTSFASAPAAE